MEHELQLPKKAKLDDLLFYDGQLCVFAETSGIKCKFYWSSNPKVVADCHHYSRERIGGAVVDLEGGGTFTGRKTVHTDDAESPDSPSKFLYDGEHFWRLEWREQGHGFREIDPKTGKEGRWSMPSFLEDYLQSGEALIEGVCELMHLEAVQNSPLGSKAGQIGWRVKKTKSGKVQSEGIDGRSWSGELQELTATAMVDQPGTSNRLPITGGYGWDWSYAGTKALWDSTGKFELAHWDGELGDYNRGQAASFPPMFWHAFQVRDQKTSKALRSINQAQAKKLLSAVFEDREQSDEIENPLADLPGTQAALKKWLTGLKHPRLPLVLDT
jgi:hypothetical protein